MKINKCNDECRVWTGLGTQHRTHLSEDWGRSLWHWQPQSRICFLRWAQSQRPTRWRRTFVNIISCRSFVSLSRSSTSTSRSDRSAQAKPPSAMSSDSAEFSPELRVSICHRVHTGSVWTVPDDWSMTRPVFVFLPFFQVKPKTSAKVSGFKDRHNDWPGHVCLFSYIKWCPMFSAGEGFRQRGTAAASKWNAPGHGWVQSDRFWLSGTNSPRELNLTT